MRPATYERRAASRGTLFDLPTRNLGKKFLVPLVLVTLVGVAVAGWFCWSSIENIQQAKGLDVVFACIPLLFSLSSLVPIAIVSLFIFGRNQIEVQHEDIVAIDRLGPFRYSRRRKIDQIGQLEVNTATMQSAGSPRKSIDSFATLTGLTLEAGESSGPARFKGGFLMAWGYPNQLLRQLADEIAADIDRDHLVGGQKLAVVERTGNETPIVDGKEPTFSQPEESKCEIERTGDGISIRVPPAGFWTGSKGMALFSIIWLTFIAIFTTVMLVGMFSDDGDQLKEWQSVVIFVGLVSLFWGVGIGMFIAALNLGRSEAALVTIGPSLLIMRKSLFGTKQYEWTASEISRICVGHSGMTVNDVPVMQLQIHLHESGKAVGMLTQLDDEDLEWIAYELRQALGVARERAN